MVSKGRLPRLIAITAFALAVVVLLWLRRDAIGGLTFFDPDDALRLVQVRDLLSGQAWWDIGQHRIDPPLGGDMHWSRLVDAPLALIILTLTPIVGTPLAEMAATTLWPLALFALLGWLVWRVGRRLDGEMLGAAALVVLAVTPMTLMQFAPMRIDHHGFQALLAFAALAAALRGPGWINGALAGLALALHADISIEALPYMLLFGGLFALGWLRDPANWARLAAYLAVLALASALVLFATHGPRLVMGSFCDALSRPYLAGLSVAAIALLASAPLLGRFGLAGRIGALALAGAAGGAAFALADPKCLSGPFEALPPLVDRLWYQNVKEGLPLWRQDGDWLVMSLTPSLIGLAGTFWAWRNAVTPETKQRWLTLLILAGGAVAVSLLLLRAMYVTHLFVLPGTAALLLMLWTRGRALHSAIGRVLAALAVVALVPAPATALAIALVKLGQPHEELTVIAPGPQCTAAAQLAFLDELPPATIFAPLDIGPDILLDSPHGVIATGHHRNAQAMEHVIRTFIAAPDAAEAMVRQKGAAYVALCPGLTEIENYETLAPAGLAAKLVKGQAPAWLEPVATPTGTVIKLWRVKPAKKPD